MAARQAVNDAVSGDVIVIMDAHMEWPRVSQGRIASRQAGNDTESGDAIVIIDAHMGVAESKSRSDGVKAGRE